ncbi:Peroxidase [Thalictrum thalictroides]|uniref:Peroxidase n=1 Tax=Thalictrum thalictroides TaxID=46969 RepID=A0A7J6VUI1_THATH|nr:Peroxidase [Thalictrum thalictroides]
MALPLLLSLVLVFSLTSIPAESRLSTTYYSKTCPRLQQIVLDTITNKQITSPTTAAGTLRLFFHDCMIEGCDASILISSNTFNKAERDADINHSLPGDAFDVVVRAKTALEIECPGKVSCSDILALATRDLVTMVGGPFYQVYLGRKDGFVSKASNVEGKLPKSDMGMDDIINLFTAKRFSIQEMVALSGAHTIGFSHCKEFANRLFNYSKYSSVDPTLNPRYADGLKKACANYQSNPEISTFNDLMTPNKFDNMYYQNLPRGLGLLATDRAMIEDLRTRPFALKYAYDQTVFFEDFARAMEKLSLVGVKQGKWGEIRRRCDAFNYIKTSN